MACLPLTIGAAHAAPENGWWWNPGESGRGFFIEMQGTQVYLGGYFYADDGRALWLVNGYIFRQRRPSPVAPGTTIETSWDFKVKN